MFKSSKVQEVELRSTPFTTRPRSLEPLDLRSSLLPLGRMETSFPLHLLTRSLEPFEPFEPLEPLEPFKPLELYRLPSSSRAYPLSLEKKAEAYKLMFQHYGLC